RTRRRGRTRPPRRARAPGPCRTRAPARAPCPRRGSRTCAPRRDRARARRSPPRAASPRASAPPRSAPARGGTAPPRPCRLLVGPPGRSRPRAVGARPILTRATDARPARAGCGAASRDRGVRFVRPPDDRPRDGRGGRGPTSESTLVVMTSQPVPPPTDPTTTPSWTALTVHRDTVEPDLRTWFAADPDRA